MSIEDFFLKNLGYRPYQYQVAVAELLLNGKNVILSVPTGAGKTWASIIPFLFAIENQLNNYPSKMIYSLPLRALTNSIYQDVKEKISTASIQTGEYSEDKYFEKDIIFSTIDQTLSNFLCFPLPLSHGQANINAGALIGSYLVFDEFHLLDPNLSMATTLGMLKMLGNLTKCCIMTATLSDGFMKDLKENLTNYEVITLDDFPEDKKRIASLLPIEDKKKINIVDETITAQKIAENHVSKTIVICNRVESAQRIYQDLIELKKGETIPYLEDIANDKIICLHSRFFNNDRKVKEDLLKSLFGKKCNKDEQAILIATQVIEAGMDISCNVMHTEISPVNSFLQRAGRCARFAHEKGTIFIYNILDEEDKVELETALNDEDKKEIRRINNKYLPYPEDVCKRTFVELKNYSSLDGDIPKKLIQDILGENEKELIGILKAGQGGGFNQDKIRESWNNCNKNHYRSTIRDVQSVEITLINDEMCNEVAKYPYRYQSFGMYKWSLVGWLNKVIKGEGPITFNQDDWLIKELKEAPDIFLENDEDEKFELMQINPGNFKSIPAQVYLNSKYFGYKEDFGFNWQYLETFDFTSPLTDWKENEDGFKPLTKDTFYEHNKGLIGAFEKEFLPGLNFIFPQLAKYIEIPELTKNDFIELVKLMIVLHDYGKLNTKWQKPMQTYQALKENIDLKSFIEVLAHTSYNSRDECDINVGKKALLYKRGAHAGVGAYVAQEIIPGLYKNDFLKILKSSISMAIARHHSPLSKTYPDFKITGDNYKAIQQLLDEFKFDIALERINYTGNLDSFETGWYGEHIIYLFFVRILRLCDQKATENLSKYFNRN